VSPASAIVVGAGIVGAACAEALAVAGLRVRVLERGRAGGGATAAGMGHVLVLDDSDAQCALTRLGRELWDARRDTWPAAVEREGCGTIWVAADADELEAAGQKQLWLAERGVRAEVLDAADLYRREPNLRPGLRGGLRLPDDSVVYPPAAARHLLDEAARHGAGIEELAPVRSCGEGFVEFEDGRRATADVVIVAAGTATPGLVGLPAATVRPKKGHLAITDRQPGFVRHQLVELGYLKSAHGAARESVAFNVQPRATGQLLIGSSRQVDAADPAVEAAILGRMLARALDFLPGLASIPVIRTWVGFRPSTDDNLPLLGPLPDRPRLWLATGHEGTGITTSLSSARILADRLLGRTPAIDPAPYDSARLGAEVRHG
jgi:glycine/D-amino acid oxidase-like deaminating enzyme